MHFYVKTTVVLDNVTVNLKANDLLRQIDDSRSKSSAYLPVRRKY